MHIPRTKSRYTPSLDITALIDVVFLLLIFLLLTMTFSQDKTDVEEAIIDIELARSSTTQTKPPPQSITLLIDETGALYQADSPVARTQDELRLYLADQFLSHPDLAVSLKADHRTRHGDVVEALDLIKSLGIPHVQLVIEKSKAQ